MGRHLVTLIEHHPSSIVKWYFLFPDCFRYLFS